MQNRSQTQSAQILLFARNFFRHPRMLGSVVPSSRFLVDRLLGRVDWQRAHIVVEYGPGVGNITTAILNRMQPDAILLVIETNDEFVRFLRESLRDPRLHVHHGSAADVRRELARMGHDGADYVISGIPFSTMPPEVRDDVIEATRAVLAPRGTMLVYQFSRAVLPYLRRKFGRVEEAYELRNILPAHVFRCTP